MNYSICVICLEAFRCLCICNRAICF